ncbi:TRAM domain-containing protein [Halobacterium salinarum]|uniref:TRAM domain-containing protein n=1 Tax=Halobacterium salinarum TaxID=2242 RepID=UPI002555C90D|nr:TRAM domain-containing protein [Halobacterium salinarum]MDL0129085.1 TRAM domain-containing protein [Halobacterium salinarum]MDL0135066.1 TRAM domain-containing protein [Halobacterium salinarum]
MEIPTQLRCLFGGAVEQQDGTYLIEIPEREIDLGDLQQGETYRVAVLGASATDDATETPTGSQSERTPSTPPVAEGEQRTVEIEDIGEQGDGITRVERGFVVIVPDTERGERVPIEITDVTENVAFAEVAERENYD